jgi:hypothetical protein
VCPAARYEYPDKRKLGFNMKLLFPNDYDHEEFQFEEIRAKQHYLIHEHISNKEAEIELLKKKFVLNYFF